jgi:hypothetical protein
VIDSDRGEEPQNLVSRRRFLQLSKGWSAAVVGLLLAVSPATSRPASAGAWLNRRGGGGWINGGGGWLNARGGGGGGWVNRGGGGGWVNRRGGGGWLNRR